VQQVGLNIKNGVQHKHKHVQEEFILMIPFNPKKKDNLSAWMVARSDGEYYGKLMVYRFPKDRLVYGPKQIVARINQDTEISRQISLWDQRGSQVIQGTLLVIPIENSLIYVQPLYLRAETGKIPELKRVIVAYENRIAMEETLDAALSRIFGDVRVSEEAGPSKAVLLPAVKEEKGLASVAGEHFDRAMNAQREGNWALYGEEIRKLGFESLRTDTSDYFEAVIIKEELASLQERLKNFLGEPAWPSKNKLSSAIENKINGFGGIMPGQTLYFRNEGHDSIFAMLWPWQDGKRTTVKIIRK